MKIIFYGGRQAGWTALMSCLARGYEIVAVIPQDETIEIAAKSLDLPIFGLASLDNSNFHEELKKTGGEIFLCCHGKKIIRKNILDNFKCVNIHPCLWKYPGANPIERLLRDNERKISVAMHKMTDKVDKGDVIKELFKERTGKTVVEVYKELYPLYEEIVGYLPTIEKK
ncbi:MAG: hypothetical protein QS98_C0004G0011 [archaeon GW2011_AR3]|nr:MAG: hypothetical protein QS98_C0004G0011 [archaeon GW2011_AR3]MBS3109565.1 hypothetical protein [Candidatus Woesearchaeota archaeon]